MTRYGIKYGDDWVTQDGRVLVSRSESDLKELKLGGVARVPLWSWFRGSVDLTDAYRESPGHVTVHRTTIREVDRSEKKTPDIPEEVDVTPEFKEKVVHLDPEDLEMINRIVDFIRVRTERRGF